MAATITLDNLEDGQEIYVPFTVTGTAAAAPGDITAIAWQIDNQDLNEFAVNPAAPSVAFDAAISTAQCPQADTWFLLTVLAWDSNGDVVSTTRSFLRLSDIATEADEEQPHG